VSALSTLLDGYIAEDELAAEPNAPCKRTLARYRAEPDGLPYMRFRGRVYIPIKEAGVAEASRSASQSHEESQKWGGAAVHSEGLRTIRNLRRATLRSPLDEALRRKSPGHGPSDR
jgi:hypothetical protein